MPQYGEFLSENEQKALQQGDGALRRSQALFGIVDLTEKLGLSEELSHAMVLRLRERLEDVSDEDARKIAKAMGKVTGLIVGAPIQEQLESTEVGSIQGAQEASVEEVIGLFENQPPSVEQPTAVETAPMPFHEEYATKWGFAVGRGFDIAYEGALSGHFNAEVMPDANNVRIRRDAIIAVREHIQNHGPLETVADFTKDEIFNLRVLLGWFKGKDGDQFIDGKPLNAMLRTKGLKPADRVRINASVESGMQKLTDAVLTS